MTKLTRKSGTQKLVLLTVIFIAVISAVLIIGSLLSQRIREQSQQNLEKQFESPQEAIKSQVKRSLYKHVSESGEVRYIEILANGQVNIYDADFNLIKSGLQGFAKINNFLESINRNLDNLNDSGGSNSLTIETNQGTIIINFDDGDSDLIDDIIEELDDIVDDTFSPTPTPGPPIPTNTPGGPTSTPSPTPPLGSSPTPTITPGGPTPTPTPLPDYMTAPPFSCDDYTGSGKPFNISNIICDVN